MEAQKQSKPWYKKWWVIAIFIIFVAPIIIATLAAIPQAAKEISEQNRQSDTMTTSEQEYTKVPNYEIKIVGNTYTDPTSRRLTFTVKNTGNKESNPACTITLQNEAGTYRGTDYVTWNTPLAPGDTKYFEGLVVITNEGAAYATKSNISCVEKSY